MTRLLSRAHSRRRRHDSTRFASKKRFFAIGEQLERRDVLATTSPIGAVLIPSTAVVPTTCDCTCTCSRQMGNADLSDGTLQLRAFDSPLYEAEAFFPAFSSRPLRDVIVSTDLIVNTSPPADELSVETTFNSTTGPEIFFDTSGLSPSNTFRVSDTVDISSLGPGRYSFTMDFTEYNSGTPGSTFNQSGSVLVGSDSNALLSPGWYLPGLDRLTVSGSGALWETGAGEMYWFTDAGATYTANNGNDNFRTLVENGGGTFTLSNRFGEEIDFSSLGLVTEKRDRFGNVLFTFSYIDADSDSVADDIDEIETRDGRILEFGYTSSRITSITDFDGRAVALAYDGSNRLESLTYTDPDDTGPLAPLVIEYGYAASTSFLETIDEGGNVTTYAYGFADDVISRENQDSEIEEFEALLVQTLVDPGSGEGTLLNPASVRLISSLGATKEDALGNVTTTIFGDFGNPTKITDALGNQTILAYNTNGQLTSRQDPDPDGASALSSPTTGFTYSSLNLIELSLPNGGTREWTYDATWNVPDSYENELGLLTLYEINSTTGLVDSMRQIIGENDETSSETDDIVTDYTYTGTPASSSDPPKGLLASITDGEGNVTVFAYNARGDVTSVTYADGTSDEATVNIHYGALGLPDYIDDELGRRTEMLYDDLGRMTKMILEDPDGAGALASPEWEWRYDVFNRVTKVIDPLDRETITTYDERNRVSKVELPDHDGDKNLTTFLTDYYETGETKTTTDPLGFETLRTYDKLRRLTKITLEAVPDPTTAVNEVQVVDFDGGTTGTFKLNGNSKNGTISLASTGNFQTVLDGIWGAGSTSVKVTSTEATITFLGAYAATNVAQMTVSDITGTGGATPSVSTTTAGEAADMVSPELETAYDNLGRPTKTIDALDVSVPRTASLIFFS